MIVVQFFLQLRKPLLRLRAWRKLRLQLSNGVMGAVVGSRK